MSNIANPAHQCCVFLCAVLCCVVCALPHETRMKCLRWVWFQLIIEKYFATFNVRRTKKILTKYHILINIIFCIEYQKAIQLMINSKQSYFSVLMIDNLNNIWDYQGNSFRFSKPISTSQQFIMLMPFHTGENNTRTVSNTNFKKPLALLYFQGSTSLPAGQIDKLRPSQPLSLSHRGQQETWGRLEKSLELFQPEGCPLSWMFSISLTPGQ